MWERDKVENEKFSSYTFSAELYLSPTNKNVKLWNDDGSWVLKRPSQCDMRCVWV